MKVHRIAWLSASFALLVAGILQIIVGEAGVLSTILLAGAMLCAFAGANDRGYSADKPDTSRD